jgi:hypothetical protein
MSAATQAFAAASSSTEWYRGRCSRMSKLYLQA